MRALRLRKPCASQPSEIHARSLSSSLSTMSSSTAGFLAFGFAFKPNPTATAKQVSIPVPLTIASTNRVQPPRLPPASQVGSRMSASPVTPPSPAGNGQPAPCGNEAAQAAASISPMTQNIRRSPSRLSARWVMSRQPHTAIGNTNAIAAMPNSCISKSDTTAPGPPSMLRIGLLVAWLSEGSCTDQVTSASVSATASRISAIPPSSRSRRFSDSRTESDRSPRLSRPRSIARMGRSPPLYPSTATRRCSASAVVSLSCTMATRI